MRYHPVVFHLLDVGHAALALWDTVLPEITRHRIAKALGCSNDDARILVAFLAAIHDVGKASPGFQFQPTALDWIRERLHSAGLSIPANPHNEPHNFISAKELFAYWKKERMEWKVGRDCGKVLAHITGAHHGTFPRSEDYIGWKEDVVGDATWEQARLETLALLHAALCPPDWVFPATLDWDDLGAVPLLAGFIAVADWIGSSKHFPLEGHRDGTDMSTVAEYVPRSRQRAAEALADFGWTKTPTPGLRTDFQAFWGFNPNALQEVIATRTAEVEAPFLLIAEAPMGIGKTEGALWATDAALSARVNAGFYVALPTQATSNAMHARVHDFLHQRRFDTKDLHLQLVHGNAALSDDVKVVFSGLNDIYDPTESDEAARIFAMSWFCGAKRPLLAPFGVGTIDQSLMATLQTKHWFVRLFGLAGKVILFDEVHAYDTYMSELLATLIGWLKELGCSVVLLSATLPTDKRAKLLEAWGVEPAPQEAAYPRVTWCSGNQKTADSLRVSPHELQQKSLAIEHLQPAQLGETLRRKLESGGCAAVICNTVAEAQELFGHLRSELGDWVEPDNWILFHARMPFGWRRDLEKKILDKFGKKKANRPKRAIVVATQVIEQSLDLDFDWMASFMAPTDLLLQRLGRLHRHERDENRNTIVRPAGLEIPAFTILSETAPESGQERESVPTFGNSEAVYEREILLRSWLQWQGKEHLELPGEIEPLIEATYTSEPQAPNAAWEKALSEAHVKAEIKRGKAQDTAKKVIVSSKNVNDNPKDPDELVEAPSLDLHDEENPSTHASLRAATRDGDPAITAVCLCQHEGRFYLPNRDGFPDLKHEIVLTDEPKQWQVKNLMDFTIPLSQRYLYRELVKETVLAGWKKSPLLRYTRPLIFTNRHLNLGGRDLTLDGKLGLIITKEKEMPGEEVE